MAYKHRGVLARAGPYTKGSLTLYKKAEDLKVIAQDQFRGFDITMGHPEDRIVGRENFLGTVTPHWDEDTQTLWGEFWFYDEHLHKIPDDVLQRLKDNQPVGISHGFKYRLVGEDMKDMHVSHVALLRPDEKGICPLHECGVNVRLESDSLEYEYRYEQASELQDPNKPVVSETQEKPVETKAPQVSEPAGFNETQLAQIRDILSNLMSALPTPVEQEPKVVEEPKEVIPEVVQTPKPKPQVEPARTIPRDATTDDRPEVAGGVFVRDGVRVISKKIAGTDLT